MYTVEEYMYYNDNLFRYVETCDEPNSKMDLIIHFNYRNDKIEKNLMLFYNDNLSKDLFYNIYIKLCEDLSYSIAKGMSPNEYYNRLSDMSSEIVKENIKDFDPFSEEYTLSKGVFNDIQKDIVRLMMPDLISENYHTNSNHAKQNREIICKKYNITNSRYQSEKAKTNKEILKTLKKEKKTKKIRLLIK